MIERRPPEHVRATFGLHGMEPVPTGIGPYDGWRCGEVVLTPAVDPARAAWSAKVREGLEVDGVRLARPVRSTDGRYVVSGWRADTIVDGSCEPRYDEVIAAAQRFHAVTAALPRPRFLTGRNWRNDNVFVLADVASWADNPLGALGLDRGQDIGSGPSNGTATTNQDGGRSIDLLMMLSSMRKPVHVPDQLVHGDLFGTVLFHGSQPPGLTDITAYWRPAPWAAAVLAVDALSWGDADTGLLQRWDCLAQWPQMLLRATMFRLAVHALHPRATPEAFTGLARTVELVRFLF